MSNAILDAFEEIVGKTNVISDEQKLPWGKDYTKHYTPAPLLIVFPQDTAEVQRCVKYCYDNGIAVVPSGGRTGLSGGAVAAQQEVVISTNRMKKIYDINKTERLMHCQAGVITKEVQKAALDADLYFPVDFAASGSSHIGGNISTNAGGIKVIRYGLTRQWVQGLKVVTGNGSVLDMTNATVKNNTGYDLKQLFIGAEGTLGIITEILLKLTAPPAELAVSLFGLETLENVTRLFDLATNSKLNLTAYEFFTSFAVTRVQEHTGLKSPFAQSYPYYALVEIEKVTEGDQNRLEDFVQKALEGELITDGVMAQSSQQFGDFWGLRENISESLSSLTVAHKNDISLPLSKITAFTTDLENLARAEYPGFEVVNFGHIGDGNLHVNFIKPEAMDKQEFFKFCRNADKHMFELVKKYGGSVSAEHGVGLTKKPFLHYTRSPEELFYMKAIKAAFDPKNIMNPGKIF